MKRSHKHSPYRITMNYAFDQAIKGCASNREGGTRITRGVVEAYYRLRGFGHAHSIEVWYEDKFVGSICDVTQGTLFYGESIFSRMEDASKAVLLVFYEEFIGHGDKLINCQVLNDHTTSPGACEIPRQDYLNYSNQMRLGRLLNNFWVPRCLLSPQEWMFSAHSSPECYNCGRRVGYAHYPTADREFFASGNACRLPHRSLIRCAFGAA